MKCILAMFTCFAMCIASADSYFPEEKPPIELKEALEIAETYFEKNNKEKEGFYLSKIECLYLEGAEERAWLIGWASPKKGWYFLAVELNGEVKENPKQWTPPDPEIVVIPVIDLEPQKSNKAE